MRTAKKRKYKRKNENMKQIKGVQLGAVLAAMLLVAVVFAGAAVPNKEFKSGMLLFPVKSTYL